MRDGGEDYNISLAEPTPRCRKTPDAVQSALTPWIVQVVGTVPRVALEETCNPLMNQIAAVPALVSRQRMSPLPSPLKSPVSATIQLPGTAPRLADCETCEPFRSQIATVPVV